MKCFDDSAQTEVVTDTKQVSLASASAHSAIPQPAGLLVRSTR